MKQDLVPWAGGAVRVLYRMIPYDAVDLRNWDRWEWPYKDSAAGWISSWQGTDWYSSILYRCCTRVRYYGRASPSWKAKKDPENPFGMIQRVIRGNGQALVQRKLETRKRLTHTRQRAIQIQGGGA